MTFSYLAINLERWTVRDLCLWVVRLVVAYVKLWKELEVADPLTDSLVAAVTRES